MAIITYVPSDAYPTISGATVQYGASGLTFDIKAALVAGSGSFPVNDGTPDGAALRDQLDRHIAVKRSGSPAADPAPHTYADALVREDNVLVRDDPTRTVIPSPGSGSLTLNTIADPTSTQDLTAGKAHNVTLTRNVTFTFSGASSTQESQIDLQITQDGTGSRSVTWPGSVSWANGLAPAIPQGAGSSLLLTFASLDGGTTWIGAYGGQPAAGPLKAIRYNPGTLLNVATTTTLADVDSTNLAITFTAPPSGKVLVKLDGYASGTTASTQMSWGLREGSTTIDEARIFNAALGIRQHADFLVTGLTPGSSHTYKWAHRHTGAAGATLAGGGDPLVAGVGAAAMVIDAVAA